MGSEPACTLFTFVPAAPAAATGQQAAAAAADAAGGSAQAAAPAAQQQGQQQGQPLLRLAHTLSCQPHKLLTCHLEQAAPGAQEPPTPDTHLPGGGSGGSGGTARGSRLLLGLTDDVDCAVVTVSCRSQDVAAGESGAGGAEEAAAGFVIEHATSLPALAYVTAGGRVGGWEGGWVGRPL